MTAVVAGHLCLDITPIFETPPQGPSELFAPGRLFPIESTLFSAGGAVANTGGALFALGIDTRLVARVGADGFGAAVRELLEKGRPKLGVNLSTSEREATSYSIIISSPRFDRIFFHHSGANDGFTAADLGAERLAGADLLHFGYPPAMRSIYENDGEELLELLRRAKQMGMTTSLDLSYPHPGSGASRASWRRLLARVLPVVDLFLPGYGELRFLLSAGHEPAAAPTFGLLRETAQWVIDQGCPVCVLKIGIDGLYVRTTAEVARLASMGRCGPRKLDEWRGRELLEPCYVVEARGTTGAGDVTIAGFLAALLRGFSLDEVIRMALAAGAASVEGVDALTALPSWEGLVERSRRWTRRSPRLRIEEG